MKYLMMLAIVAIGFNLQAQEPKVKSTAFKTSAVCEECKERIEKELNYTKGVIFAELDVETKVLTVKYKTKDINSMQLKLLVSSIGYDAGEVPRDNTAFEKLPKCCKSEGHCGR